MLASDGPAPLFHLSNPLLCYAFFNSLSLHASLHTEIGYKFRVERPDEVWTADITYVPTEKGWLYVAALKDLFVGRAARRRASPVIQLAGHSIAATSIRLCCGITG